MVRAFPRRGAIDGLTRSCLALVALAIVVSPLDADAQHRRRHHGGSHPHHEDPAGGEDNASPAPPTAPASAATVPSAALTSAGAPPEPLRQPPPPPLREQPIEPAVRTTRVPAIDVQIGPRLEGRSLWFTDDLFRQLRPYNLAAAPGVAGSLEFYPGALVSNGAASWFGIVASGAWAPLLSSHDSIGNAYPTTAFGFSGGLRGGYRAAGLDLGAVVAYGYQTFAFEGLQALGTSGLPNVTYQFIRTGLSGRIQITSRFAVMASGAYLIMLSTGQIGAACTDQNAPCFFPHATAGGAEAGVGAAFGITSGLEVRLNLDWRRFFFGMHPVPADLTASPRPFIAGGAVDDYYSATLSIAYRR